VLPDALRLGREREKLGTGQCLATLPGQRRVGHALPAVVGGLLLVYLFRPRSGT
jgi:hypothetical protein